MTESETTRMNKRAARKQARRNGWDPANLRVCLECGRTVYVSLSTRQKTDGMPKLFCTCESRGPVMVSPTEDSTDE